MSAMARRMLSAALLAGIVPSVFLSIECPAQGQDVSQHLRDQYQGKTFVLRGFPAGSRIVYDSSGGLRVGANSGDWTTSGAVRVDKLKISKSRLIVDATRLYLFPALGSGFEPKANGRVQIEAGLGPGELTADDADAIMARIFLTERDDFGALVPDYWKVCVSAALSIDAPEKQTRCRFSPELLKIPGGAKHSGKPPTPQELFGEAAAAATRFDSGVKPPKRISGSEPEFSEEARRERYEGTVTLGVIINQNGDVRKIWIISPLGYGLDLRAMEAISRWKFEPATKDGHPVAAEVVIETAFHLFN